jgi:chromosomal replication initiation ATPase DnaA
MRLAATVLIDEFSVRSSSRPRVRNLRLARLRRDRDVYLLTRTVARVHEVSLRQMLASERGTAREARARQLAMYLAHVLLGRRQDAVGLLFGRDTSTVSYACRVIEDRRDEPSLEAEIAKIEGRLSTAREDRDAA